MKHLNQSNGNENIHICQMYVMVGPAGSGKSTWLKKHTKYSDWIVSRDKIRFEMLGENDSYFSKENEVFDEFIRQIAYGIECKDKIYVDATHINTGSRRKLFKALDALVAGKYETYFVCMSTSLQECINRNSQRTGRAYVNPDVIEDMYRHMSKPRMSEHESIKGIWSVNE